VPKVHGTIDRTAGMLGVRSAPGCSRFHRLSLAGNRLSTSPGQCKKHRPQKNRILPEPETRNGLSLARNDAYATITRSMLPPCSFASTPETLCKPVRSKAPPLDSVSKPKPGEFITMIPLSTAISGALVTAPISTPLQALSNLPDRSVQPVESQQARLA
jgi:hypothetical protein